MKILIGVALLVAALPAAAGCFDRSLIVSRYHFPNPANLCDIWQDLYRLDMASATSVAATRLSRGAIAPPRRDSTWMAVSSDGLWLIFIEADAGGTAPRLRLMKTVDSDGDLEGDGLTTLDDQGLDIGDTAWGPENRVVYPKLDTDGVTQLALAVLSDTTLGPVTLLTDAESYPDHPAFVDPTQMLYDMDGNTLMHLDLSTRAVTILSLPGPMERSAVPRPGTKEVFFLSVQGTTLDLWKAELRDGPALTNLESVLSTNDRNEVALAVSPDGNCLAFLAADLTVPNGPNSDLWIRDLGDKQTQQITFTRDISGVAWLPLPHK